MSRSLLVSSDLLRCLSVIRVVIEATSDYQKPVLCLLEAVRLVNSQHVKRMPGQPNTDKLDAICLATFAERQITRPSFVPPPPIIRPQVELPVGSPVLDQLHEACRMRGGVFVCGLRTDGHCQKWPTTAGPGAGVGEMPKGPGG
ncbi:hypothetical protein ACIBG8_41940 [Nonomuraea sp. NPDC050556]|uniref:hypothetical protein n=1 Tax=Nonomuraea sp. NPDC050556 TaxID=3364369 RepID=UPI00378A6C91